MRKQQPKLSRKAIAIIKTLEAVIAAVKRYDAAKQRKPK